MRNIDFRTAHNIVLSYPMAGVGTRILAFAIDLFIVLIATGIAYAAIGINIFSLLISSLLILIYHLSFEVFNMGRSPGKMLTKIRVVALDGKSPTLKQYLIRWAFRMLDIMITGGNLAVFSVYSSTKEQRIGDLLAGTTVVKTEHYMINNLNDLLRLNKTTRKIKFPNVIQYSDEDMILVKNMLSRYRAHPNEENDNLLFELAQKIKKDLNLNTQQMDKADFIEEVLNDYILLTR